eukprot:152716_1
MSFQDDQYDIVRKQIHNLYQRLKQYNEYISIKEELQLLQLNQNHESHYNCCYSISKPKTIKIIKREIVGNTLVLHRDTEHNSKISMQYDEDLYDTKSTHDKEEKELKTFLPNVEHTKDNGAIQQIQTNPTSIESNEVETIQISSTTYNIEAKDLVKGDTLSEIKITGEDEPYSFNGMQSKTVYELIKYEPIPFTLTFEQTDCIIKCCASNKTHNETRKCDATEKMLGWLVKFMKLSQGVVSKASSVLDAVTDIILLYKASTNNAILFTMILFITLLSPYILSYSSGVQIFLYRR